MSAWDANQSEEHEVSNNAVYGRPFAKLKECRARIFELEAKILQLKDDVGDEWARAEQGLERIAELDAERDAQEKWMAGFKALCQEWSDKCDALKAELAAMKARCCDNCANTTCGPLGTLKQARCSPSWFGAEEGIMCRLWAERSAP